MTKVERVVHATPGRGPLQNAVIGVGIYEEHNAGFAAVAEGKVLQYAEWERYTRVKNQAGWMPELFADFLRRLPMERIGAICAPRPNVVVCLLRECFGGRLAGKHRVVLGGHTIEVFDQRDLHPYFHLLSMLVLPGLLPGVYAVLIADAEQPRVGWVDLRGPVSAPIPLHLISPSPERWFNGEIFSGVFGKIFYGTDKLENCGKLMGLASWGRVRLEYVELLRQLAEKVFDESRPAWQGYEEADAEELQKSVTKRLDAHPMRHEATEIQDLAASAQELFRHKLIATVDAGLLQVRSDLAQCGLPEPKAMLYSGGCGLSVVTNSALRKAIGMPLIVAPYTHDSAQFVGAAVYASLKSSPEVFPLGRGWPGIPDHTVGQIETQQLVQTGLSGSRVSPRRVAEFLLQGHLIAYLCGGSEAGPRALGHRSLFANALDPGIRDRLNLQVKKREWYRPFAPMVLESEFPRYFAESATPCASYMLDAYCLVPQYRSLLAAVSSPDGLSRPQAVGGGDEWLRDLLLEMRVLTGHPIVLNTSLNAPGKPIALDGAQALRDCDVLGLDAVVSGQFLFSRNGQFREGRGKRQP